MTKIFSTTETLVPSVFIRKLVDEGWTPIRNGQSRWEDDSIGETFEWTLWEKGEKRCLSFMDGNPGVSRYRFLNCVTEETSIKEIVENRRTKPKGFDETVTYDFPKRVSDYLHGMNGWLQENFQEFYENEGDNYTRWSRLVEDFMSHMRNRIHDDFDDHPDKDDEYKRELLKELENLGMVT
jgi:hypothetical protein